MTTKTIYTSPKRHTFIRIRNACILLFALLECVFRAKNGHSIAIELGGENASIIGICLILPTILLGFISHIISRRKKQVGILTMTEDNIIIEQKKETLKFNVLEIADFKIKQSFSDVDEKGTVLISSYDNWLQFKYNNSNYEYQFILGSSYSTQQFKDLINVWKVKCTNFSIEKTK